MFYISSDIFFLLEQDKLFNNVSSPMRNCPNVTLCMSGFMPCGAHKGNSSVTHVTFFQFFYFHWATIKHLVDQSHKFKAYDDLGAQLYITT